jgi:ribose transport system permease protein
MSDSAPAPQVDAPPPALDRLKRLVIDQPLIMLGVILVLLVIACVIVKSSYFSTGQLGAILRYAAPLAILAGGQTLAMLTRGIDLSMGATATASAYVMASNASDGTFTAILLGLCVGLLVGLVNGVGIGIFQVQPLIMTLGMAGIVTGLLTVQAAQNRTGGTEVPSIVRKIGGEPLFGKGSLDFIPNSLILWIVVSALLILGLRRTGYGRMLYAYGNNPQAMRLAGMRAWQLLTGTYVVIGLLSAIAGITLAGLINAADLGLADSFLLPSVAAAVIGGTSIFGGIGTYGGTIMGALILTVLDSFLTLLNADDSYRQILYGLIILLLVTFYAQVQRRA